MRVWPELFQGLTHAPLSSSGFTDSGTTVTGHYLRRRRRPHTDPTTPASVVLARHMPLERSPPPDDGCQCVRTASFPEDVHGEDGVARQDASAKVNFRQGGGGDISGDPCAGVSPGRLGGGRSDGVGEAGDHHCHWCLGLDAIQVGNHGTRSRDKTYN